MKFIAVVLLVAVVAYTAASEDFVCEDGVPYKENNCNGCFCSKGELACTLMACEGSDKLFNCEAGTVTTKGCNTCKCVPGKGTICTNHDCSKVPTP